MKKIFLFAIALLLTQLSRAQWEDDFNLSDTPDTSYITLGMSRTLAAKGDTIHVVWYEKTEEQWEIFYTQSTDGGLNWEWATRLTYTEGRSSTPSLSVSGSSVYVVWVEKIEGNYEICFKRSPDSGETWGEDILLTDDDFYPYEPVIAVSGSYVHVVWVDWDNQENLRLYYKNSPDGGVSWEDEQWLSANSPKAWNPTIEANGSDVFVAWNDERDINIEIYFSKSSNNGSTWGPETRLTYDLNMQLFPSVALSGQSVHIAWYDDRFGEGEICYKRSTDGGATWSEDIRVTDDPAASWNPNLAVSGSVIHLVWQDARSGRWDIYYNHSTDGGDTWATETILNDFSFMSYRPHIAVDGNVLHVVWYDYRDFNYEIYYKRNPTGGMVGVEEQLRAEGGGLRVYPNPACQQLTVDSRQLTVRSSQFAGGSSQMDLRFEILDLVGREIKIISNIPALPCTINISNLPDGIYILKMMDESGSERSAKFMKIKE